MGPTLSSRKLFTVAQQLTALCSGEVKQSWRRVWALPYFCYILCDWAEYFVQTYFLNFAILFHLRSTTGSWFEKRLRGKIVKHTVPDMCIKPILPTCSVTRETVTNHKWGNGARVGPIPPPMGVITLWVKITNFLPPCPPHLLRFAWKLVTWVIFGCRMRIWSLKH